MRCFSKRLGKSSNRSQRTRRGYGSNRQRGSAQSQQWQNSQRSSSSWGARAEVAVEAGAANLTFARPCRMARTVRLNVAAKQIGAILVAATIRSSQIDRLKQGYRSPMWSGIVTLLVVVAVF